MNGTSDHEYYYHQIKELERTIAILETELERERKWRQKLMAEKKKGDKE